MAAVDSICTRVGPKHRDLRMGIWNITSLNGKEQESVWQVEQCCLDIVKDLWKQVGVIAYPMYSASVAFLRVRRINIEIKKKNKFLYQASWFWYCWVEWRLEAFLLRCRCNQGGHSAFCRCMHKSWNRVTDFLRWHICCFTKSSICRINCPTEWFQSTPGYWQQDKKGCYPLTRKFWH